MGNTYVLNLPYMVSTSSLMSMSRRSLGKPLCSSRGKSEFSRILEHFSSTAHARARGGWTGEEKTVDVEHLVNPELVRLSQRGASYIIYGTPAPAKSTYMSLGVRYRASCTTTFEDDIITELDHHDVVSVLVLVSQDKLPEMDILIVGSTYWGSGLDRPRPASKVKVL